MPEQNRVSRPNRGNTSLSSGQEREKNAQIIPVALASFAVGSGNEEIPVRKTGTVFPTSTYRGMRATKAAAFGTQDGPEGRYERRLERDRAPRRR